MIEPPETKMLLVSVIVPTYNRRELLSIALQSVLGQSYPRIEVVVVDDASTDDTEEFVRTWAQSEPRIIYHRNDRNMGLSYNRNIGVTLCTGDYISILDDDDELCPFWAERMLAAARGEGRNESLDLVQCKAAFVSQPSGSMLHAVKSSHIVRSTRGLRPGESPAEYLLVNGAGIPQTTSYLWHRRVFEKIRFFPDVPNADDMIFAVRSLNVAQTYAFVDEALYAYRFEYSSVQMNRKRRDVRKLLEATFRCEKELSRHELIVLQFFLPVAFAFRQREYLLAMVVPYTMKALRAGVVAPRVAAKMIVSSLIPNRIYYPLKQAVNRW